MISNHVAPSVSIRFGERLAASAMFDALFRDGMALVEETAAYLDGPGRDDSRYLTRVLALAYASESMRLTTRLMQVASWLLLQRAINEGEMTERDAASDKRRSQMAWQGAPIVKPAENGLPQAPLDLIDKSMHLQDRIQRLDALISAPTLPVENAIVNPLEAQLARLRDAFSN